MRVPGTAPMPAILDLVRAIEGAGFDGAGILDSQLLARDTFVTLALAAGATNRLRLFPAVTNPFTRHPSVLASAIQTVEDLAPGRIEMVIGTGYTSAITIGRKPSTLGEMRACVMTVKRLLAGDAVDFGGANGKLGYASRRAIPVLVAASGPKMIELAAEIADGVLVLAGFNAGIIDEVRRHLEHGAARAGRSADELRVVWAVRTGTAATSREARRLARPVAVHWAFLGWAGRWLEVAGLRLPKLEIPDAIWNVYPDLSHAANWEEAIAATSFVPDDVVAEVCDAIGLVGTPDDCASRMLAMAKLGACELYLMPFQSFAPPEPEIRAFRDVVFPRLRAAGLRE